MKEEKIKQIGDFPFYALMNERDLWQIVVGNTLMSDKEFENFEDVENHIYFLFGDAEQVKFLTNYILALIDNFDKIKNLKK